MFGINTEQWRSSIGHFNSPKNTPRPPADTCKVFLIFSHLMYHLSFFKDYVLPFFLLTFNIILLFGYSSMFVTLLTCAAVSRMGLWILNFDALSPRSEIYVTLYLAFSFPKTTSLLLRKLLKLDFMESNVAFRLLVLGTLLIIAGIETNPGPTSRRNFSFAVWNLDSLPARDYARIPLIESLQAEHRFDLFGVVESALNSGIPSDSILVEGFSPDPIRADKADGTRNGGVCLYYREDLPIKSRKDLAIIPETVVAEIKINRKKIFFVLSYRHPSTPMAEFNNYVNSLETILEMANKENPSAIILSGDFNARSPLFWEGDSGTKEGEILSQFLISNNMDAVTKPRGGERGQSPSKI